MIDFNNGSVFKLSATNPNEYANELSPLLVNEEVLISSYKSIRDYVVFTNKRIIAVNVQGITGKKKDFTSIPYAKIQTFSVETSGFFDMDSELELYISSIGKIKFEFKGECDIIKIGQIISSYIL